MIGENYVSFEVAKLLKEKGFDEITFTWYTGKGKLCFGRNTYDDYHMNHFSNILSGKEKDKCSAPTLSVVMKWLREEKGVAVIPVLSSVLDNKKFLWDIKIVVAETNDTYSQGWVYEKQEDACEAAIKYCLDNLI